MRLPTRRNLRALTLLCVVLLAANFYVFFMRDWEASFLPESYATLYYPLDWPTLREWRVKSGNVLALDLAWNRTPSQWQLSVDGKAARLMPGAAPELDIAGPIFDGSTDQPLDAFKHRYALQPVPNDLGPRLDFTVNVIAAEFYRKNGMHFANDVYLVDTPVPVGKFQRYPLSYWVDDYAYVGAKDLAAADRVVREQIGVKETDDTMTRIEKVVRYLSTQLAASGGVPKDDFRWENPWLMCQEMINGTGKGWCTQNAQIYVFFANRAGIPTRFVFGANTENDTIIYNGHSWAESWVKEQGRWTYIDMTQSLFGVANARGELLNTADILHLCQSDVFDGVTARIFKDWHWKDLPFDAAPRTAITVPFKLVNAQAREQYNRQTILKFRHPPNVEDVRGIYSMLLKDRTFRWTNFRRYLWDPPAAYSMLPTDGRRTYLLRQSLAVALLLGIVLWLFALLRRAV